MEDWAEINDAKYTSYVYNNIMVWNTLLWRPPLFDELHILNVHGYGSHYQVVHMLWVLFDLHGQAKKKTEADK